MPGIMDDLGRQSIVWPIALRKGGFFALLLTPGWLVLPFVIQAIIHPSHAIGLQAWIQALPIPRDYSDAMLEAGEIEALAFLAALVMFQFGATVLFYRRVRLKIRVIIWPCALLLIGFVGNGWWWVHTGFFDLSGAIVGFVPMVMTFACERACDRLVRELYFPQYP